MSTKCSALLDISDKLDPMDNPPSNVVLSITSYFSSISSLLRTQVFEMTSLIKDLATDLFENCSIIERMSSDMPEISIFLNEASDYLISTGADENTTVDNIQRQASSKDGTIDKIKSLLQHHVPGQWRGGSRGRAPRGRRQGYQSHHRDNPYYTHYYYTPPGPSQSQLPTPSSGTPHLELFSVPTVRPMAIILVLPNVPM